MFGEDYSESPRMPSPWEAATPTPIASSSSGSGKHAHSLPRSLIPEADRSGHIEYKLRLPPAPSIDRLARLTSQLKWRLLEGGGEAIYEIGVCDNGLLLGIDREEMDASLITLQRMASGLGARVKVMREVEVSDSASADEQRDVRPLDTPHRFSLSSTSPAKAPDIPIEAASQLATSPGIRITKAQRRAQATETFYLAKQRESSLYEPPMLSHSPPSPPQSLPVSTPSDESCIQLFTCTSSVAEAHGSQIADATQTVVTAGCKASGTDVAQAASAKSEEEEARAAIRRHLRKQWKKEKKAADKAAAAAVAASASTSTSASDLYTPEERYITALVGLFDGVELQEDEEGYTEAQLRARHQRRKKGRGRGRRSGNNTGTAKQELQPSALKAKPFNGSAEQRRMMAIPPVSVLKPAEQRYTVECLVYYPDTDEDDDEEEGSSLEMDSGQNEIGVLEEDEVVSGGGNYPARPPRQFIDFEGSFQGLLF